MGGCNVSERDFMAWQAGDLLPEGVFALLQQLRAAEATVKTLERTSKTHSAHVDKVFQNQERLRRNIQSLEKVASTALVERYLKVLVRAEASKLRDALSS